MEIFLNPETWISLLALCFIEIILGVDNLVFIAIVTSRLPLHQQKKARRIGLLGAMLTRLVLLAFIVWLAGLTKPWFYLGQWPVSIRDMIMFFGGVFLLWKSIQEIIATANEHLDKTTGKATSFTKAIIEIAIFDLLFSLDSVITAVGIVREYLVMAIAIILAVLFMMVASEPVSKFILQNPRIKILALCILILVGIELILRGLNFQVSNYYLYVAMSFALGIELVNMWVSKRQAKAN